MNHRLLLLIFSFSAASGLMAQVTLTDLGSVVPSQIDTGYTGPFDQRYSFDGPGDSHGQTFLPAATGEMEYLYLAYNAGGSGTFKVHIDTSYAGGGGAEIIADATAAGKVFTVNVADFVPAPGGLSGASSDGNGNPVYWMRLDFSQAGINLTAGQAAGFVIAAVSEVASDSNFLFAPHYKQTSNPYAGGELLPGTNFTPAANGDLGFAVSLAGGGLPAIRDFLDSGTLGGGTGWTAAWSGGTVVSTSPLDSGGNYLSLPALTDSAGAVRPWDTAIVSASSASYTVRFDLRVDALPNFGASNGRIGITESSTAATNTSGSMSWMIFASTNFGLGSGGQPTWGFHDGNRSGTFVTPLVGSGLPVVTGHVYRFEVVVSPAELSYAVTIDDLDDTAPPHQSRRFGFRRNTAVTTPHLAFSTQSVTGTASLSIDSVSVVAGGTLPEQPMPPAVVADRVAGNLILLNDNGGWSWYQDERTIRDPSSGRILFTSTANHLGYGGESRDGDIDVVSFDPASGSRQRFVLGNVPWYNGTGDDHNIGGLFLRPDGRYLATYCNHNDSSRNTRIRISTHPGDNTSWNPEFTFNWSAAPGTASRNVTYSNLLYLSSEGIGQGRLYNIAREQNRDPHVSYSDDQGNTWTYGGRLSTQAASLGYSNGYFKYKSNGVDRIDFICTEAHPRDYDTSIYHGYIKGGKTFNSAGVEIDGNLFDDTAPAPQAFTPVWSSQGVGTATQHHGWTSEIELDGDGRPVVLFTTRFGNAVVDGHAGAGDHRIHFGRFNGTAWSTVELSRMGELFHSGEQDYTGIGAIHPDDPDHIFIATYFHPATGVAFPSKKREIFQGKSDDSGASWSWTQLTFDSTVDNARPIIPDWDADHTAVLWWRGDYPWQRDYDLSVVGMILDPEQKTMGVDYFDADATNTTLADGSPLVPTGPSDGTGAATDNQWQLMTGFGGNHGSAYAANFATSETTPVENAPAMRTRVNGLAAGTYDVFVYFLSPPVADDWRVSAGFSPGELMHFRRASSQQAEASQFSGPVEILWADQKTALYRGYIGRKSPAADGSLDVFIDDTASRVAYDGIGLARVVPNLNVPSGSARVLHGDQTTYGDVFIHGSLVLKGSSPLSYLGAFTNLGFLDLMAYGGPISSEWLQAGRILMPGDVPGIHGFSLHGGIATVSIDSLAGHDYRLQHSPDLSPGSWLNAGPSVPGVGINGVPEPIALTGPNPGPPRCFYRVAVD